MVKCRIDLTNMVFGKLTVLHQAEDYVLPNGRHEAQWLCKCNCENQTLVTVLGKNLKNSTAQSCGCIRKDRISNYNQTTKKQYNTYDLSNTYGIGLTHNTNKEFYFDLEDFDKIKDYCWNEHIYPSGYSALEAKNTINNTILKMSHLIAGVWYDHIDRNPLNNCKSNLRKATQQENACNTSLRKNNTSGVTGVYWCKTRELWIAQIQYKKQYYNLGGYLNKDDAIRARLLAEKEYFGEFAPQQHLFEKYNILIGEQE